MADVISLSSIVEASKAQISTDALGDEVVILDTNAGIYYNIVDSGVPIWSLIKEPRNVTEIVDAIIEEYEVERSQCEQDVIAHLQQLFELGLIELRN